MYCEIVFLSISVCVRAELCAFGRVCSGSVTLRCAVGCGPHLRTAAPCLGCDLCRFVADCCSCTGQTARFRTINQSTLVWPSLTCSTSAGASGALQLNFTTLKSHYPNMTITIVFSHTLLSWKKILKTLQYNTQLIKVIIRAEKNLEFKNSKNKKVCLVYIYTGASQ